LHQIDKIKENILIKGRDRNKGRCLEKKKKRTKMLDGNGIKRKEKFSTLKREYIV
jgi:hypothetical protein